MIMILKHSICTVLSLALLLQIVGCTTLQPTRAYNGTDIQKYKPEIGTWVRVTLKTDSKISADGKRITCRVSGFTQTGMTITYRGDIKFQANEPSEIRYEDIMEIEILKQKLSGKGIAIAVGVSFVILLIAAANYGGLVQGGGWSVY